MPVAAASTSSRRRSSSMAAPSAVWASCSAARTVASAASVPVSTMTGANIKGVVPKVATVATVRTDNGTVGHSSGRPVAGDGIRTCSVQLEMAEYRPSTVEPPGSSGAPVTQNGLVGVASGPEAAAHSGNESSNSCPPVAVSSALAPQHRNRYCHAVAPTAKGGARTVTPPNPKPTRLPSTMGHAASRRVV